MNDKEEILIIEDDPAHAELLTRAFEQYQDRFGIVFADSLTGARQYLQGVTPSLVLCDWRLPDGQGMEIFPEHKEEMRWPVVIMTSHGNEEVAVEAMKAGALDYIVKSAETLANMPSFVGRVLREWHHILARKQAEKRLETILVQTVESLSMLVEQRDPYTAGHQRKVARLASAIAREMGFTDDKVKGIYIAAILHDIGKISIPAEFLSKPGKLSTLEFEVMKTHPQIAYDLLKNIDFPYPVSTIVLQHHEKCDGSGYPFGLKREDILPEAKIITVADVVEAISSHRPYRPALGIGVALREITEHAGELYDEAVVDACVTLLSNNRFRF